MISDDTTWSGTNAGSPTATVTIWVDDSGGVNTSIVEEVRGRASCFDYLLNDVYQELAIWYEYLKCLDLLSAAIVRLFIKPIISIICLECKAPKDYG